MPDSKFWRITEPILLGTLANYFVNYIFSSGDPGFSITEWVVAVILCIIITEINRVTEAHLEVKLGWTRSPSKRLFHNLAYLSLSLLFVVNVIGNLYLIAKGDTFYELNEMLIINAVTFCLILILTTFRWAAQFYFNWRQVENSLVTANAEYQNLALSISTSQDAIALRKNRKQQLVKLDQLRVAISRHGFTKVVDADCENFIYDESLSSLMDLLPEHFFFQLTRNIIVHRERIVSITPDAHGKIAVEFLDENDKVAKAVVSRLKASSFRKWYKRSLTRNT